MKMTNKRWALAGGSYCALAIISFMAAVSPVPANRTAEAQDVAQISQGFTPDSQRLSYNEGRAKYWLTIWTIRNCEPCARQKALVPALEAAGFHVIVRTVPGSRWVRSFPATVITKDKPGGNILHTLYGVQTIERLDKILEIVSEEEDKEEDLDYNITR